MALVIEDGTGVTTATSYVTVTDFRAYCLARGLTIPATDAACDILLIKAMDYLESLRDQFKGERVFGLGYHQWPRYYVVIDGFELDADMIPQELIDAQCQLAFELQTYDPSASSTGPAIKSEKVGPLETVYAITDGEGSLTNLPKVEALVAPLLKSTAGMGLTTLRI